MTTNDAHGNSDDHGQLRLGPLSAIIDEQLLAVTTRKSPAAEPIEWSCATVDTPSLVLELLLQGLTLPAQRSEASTAVDRRT